jgi:hypothetical protein
VKGIPLEAGQTEEGKQDGAGMGKPLEELLRELEAAKASRVG